MTVIAGSNVLLTGASRGLGRALALRLGREGAFVGLVARDEVGLREVAAQIEGAGGKAAVLPADLGDASGIAELMERVEATLGRVHVVIHNAGIEPFVRFEDLDDGAIDRVLAVNLRAPIALTRALVPSMLAAGGGHVVFIGSTSGLFTAPFAALYGATKAAIESLALSLESELGSRGVHASVVLPGFVVGTGMFEDARSGTSLVPPLLTGSTSAEAVVSAVMGAIQHERPRVVVNSVPLGLLTAVAKLAPRLGMSLTSSSVRPFMERLSAAAARAATDQGSKR